MQNFERSSLNRKLNIISLLSTATALLFVFGAFAVTSVINHRQAESLQLAALATVIGAASSGDLMLVDRHQAQATLAALEAQQEISAAVLYDRFGRSLAEYRAPSRLGAELAPPGDLESDTLIDANRAGRALLSRHMRVVHEVRHDELAVGAPPSKRSIQEETLHLVLMALGDAMLGAPMARALDLPRGKARALAVAMLTADREGCPGDMPETPRHGREA